MPLTPCSLILLPYYSLLGSRMRRLPFRVRFNFPMASSICATRNIGPGWGNGWKPGGCFPCGPEGGSYQRISKLLFVSPEVGEGEVFLADRKRTLNRALEH